MNELDKRVTKLTDQVNALIDAAIVESLDDEELDKGMRHIRSLAAQIFNLGRSIECDEGT